MQSAYRGMQRHAERYSMIQCCTLMCKGPDKRARGEKMKNSRSEKYETEAKAILQPRAVKDSRKDWYRQNSLNLPPLLLKIQMTKYIQILWLLSKDILFLEPNIVKQSQNIGHSSKEKCWLGLWGECSCDGVNTCQSITNPQWFQINRTQFPNHILPHNCTNQQWYLNE